MKSGLDHNTDPISDLAGQHALAMQRGEPGKPFGDTRGCVRSARLDGVEIVADGHLVVDAHTLSWRRG